MSKFQGMNELWAIDQVLSSDFSLAFALFKEKIYAPHLKSLLKPCSDLLSLAIVGEEMEKVAPDRY
jgi:hypothetical protein